MSGPTIRMRISPEIRDFRTVLTTYRLTEHHTAGGMSRTLSHLAELQPELFCEVSPELAELAGLKHGDYATIITMRSHHRGARAGDPAHASVDRERRTSLPGRPAISLSVTRDW